MAHIVQVTSQFQRLCRGGAGHYVLTRTIRDDIQVKAALEHFRRQVTAKEFGSGAACNLQITNRNASFGGEKDTDNP